MCLQCAVCLGFLLFMLNHASISVPSTGKILPTKPLRPQPRQAARNEGAMSPPSSSQSRFIEKLMHPKRDRRLLMLMRAGCDIALEINCHGRLLPSSHCSTPPDSIRVLR